MIERSTGRGMGGRALVVEMSHRMWTRASP
jgi:hypothetical protein